MFALEGVLEGLDALLGQLGLPFVVVELQEGDEAFDILFPDVVLFGGEIHNIVFGHEGLENGSAFFLTSAASADDLSYKRESSLIAPEISGKKRLVY